MNQAHPGTRVALVCLGNICRSPTAHVVLEHKAGRVGLDLTIGSAGTGDWHVGEPMDSRSAAVLRDAGYDPSRHRAQTFTVDWFAEYDLLLAMDHSNRANMRQFAPTVDDEAKVQMFRAYDPVATEADDEVPDPWYGGPEGFRNVLMMIERTSESLIQRLGR